MRRILLTAVLAALMFAPAASAYVVPPSYGPPAVQDLRSPDARDAADAGHAQTLQQIARMHRSSKDDAALAQERYYSSYGPAKHLARGTSTDDGTPWLTIGLGLGLTFVVAGAVAMAVRTRRRVRLAV
jgi:hypothetical protein